MKVITGKAVDYGLDDPESSDNLNNTLSPIPFNIPKKGFVTTLDKKEILQYFPYSMSRFNFINVTE